MLLLAGKINNMLRVQTRKHIRHKILSIGLS